MSSMNTMRLLSPMGVADTIYNGYRFRSRLEARWAVFFDALGIKYEYEKEAYDLGGDGWYLPNFWLPNVGLRSMANPGLWFEVRASNPTKNETDKAVALCKLTQRPVIIYPGLPEPIDKSDLTGGFEYTPDGEDNYMQLCFCERCRLLKVEFSEGHYMYCSECGNYASDETPSVIQSMAAARQARFEAGNLRGVLV